MRIDFSERFALPVEEIFSYFISPADWGRLYGFVGARDLGSGWFAIGIKGFPFPLVAKTTALEPNRLVRWTFRGFWRGEGEVRFIPSQNSVLVEGYEEISVRYLSLLSPLVERLLLDSRFRAIWHLGWHRLRKRERSHTPEGSHAAVGEPPHEPASQQAPPG
jgi:hypothetical protein